MMRRSSSHVVTKGPCWARLASSGLGRPQAIWRPGNVVALSDTVRGAHPGRLPAAWVEVELEPGTHSLELMRQTDLRPRDRAVPANHLCWARRGRPWTLDEVLAVSARWPGWHSPPDDPDTGWQRLSTLRRDATVRWVAFNLRPARAVMTTDQIYSRTQRGAQALGWHGDQADAPGYRSWAQLKAALLLCGYEPADWIPQQWHICASSSPSWLMNQRLRMAHRAGNEAVRLGLQEVTP